MTANSKQLVGRENYQGLEVTLNVQIDNTCNMLCLDLGNKGYLLKQCLEVEKYIPKVHRKICAVNCNLFALQDL
jgi:hypothetical protein